MVLKKEVVDYLVQLGEVSGEIGDSFKKDDGMVIVGLSPDKEAKSGHLSWISKKNVRLEPERIKSFKGSLLIAPEEAKGISNEFGRVVICENPKLSFAQVVYEYFSDLTSTKWPKEDESPISIDCIMGKNVFLSKGVIIGSGVEIEDQVFIGPNTVIANCTIKNNVRIGANCSIGLPGFGYERDKNNKYYLFPHVGKVLIEEYVEIGSNTCVDRGAIQNTIIRRGAKIDNLVHIAHNVVIGLDSLIIANSMIGGSAKIGNNVWIAPSASIMNQVSIGNNSILGLGAVVLKNVEDESVMVGNPARLLKKNIRNE
jgi:UDP-3-O-[3-hydroxymyristoyl] glucosamine N-acyltransferase